jgi:hypothetical protein
VTDYTTDYTGGSGWTTDVTYTDYTGGSGWTWTDKTYTDYYGGSGAQPLYGVPPTVGLERLPNGAPTAQKAGVK